ncbi:MAG: DUF1778 domain-containing protein [Propionibacteriaceae bacterium]|nr:DUF1778 domain-containing protein [Propionibacteriaceae bacterium]
MAQPLRTRRFETRLDASTDNLITQAADQLGESRSAFVVAAARAAAAKVVEPSAMRQQEALSVLMDGMDESELSVCPVIRLFMNR